MSVSDEEWNEINENYINELKAEIERLRGALEVAQHDFDYIGGYTATLSEVETYARSAYIRIREALEGETK